MTLNHVPIDPEVALRIALAARVIDMHVSLFISVLIKAIGHPITKSRLDKLRMNRLHQCLDRISTESMDKKKLDHKFSKEHLSEEKLRQCIDLLKGRNLPQIEPLKLQIQPYIDGEMPDSIRIAFTSNHIGSLDAAFHNCKYFLVYQVSAQEIRLIDIRLVTPRNIQKNCINHSVISRDDWINQCALNIADCVLLYTCNIGGSASARVIKAGVLPIKINEQLAVQQVVESLQSVLRSPPPWLEKAMKHKPFQIASADQK